MLRYWSPVAMLANKPVATVVDTSERRPLIPFANADVMLCIIPVPVNAPPKAAAQKIRNTVLNIPLMPRVCTKLVRASLPVSIEVLL